MPDVVRHPFRGSCYVPSYLRLKRRGRPTVISGVRAPGERRIATAIPCGVVTVRGALSVVEGVGASDGLVAAHNDLPCLYPVVTDTHYQ